MPWWLNKQSQGMDYEIAKQPARPVHGVIITLQATSEAALASGRQDTLKHVPYRAK